MFIWSLYTVFQLFLMSSYFLSPVRHSIDDVNQKCTLNYLIGFLLRTLCIMCALYYTFKMYVMHKMYIWAIKYYCNLFNIADALGHFPTQFETPNIIPLEAWITIIRPQCILPLTASINIMMNAGLIFTSHFQGSWYFL